MSGGVLLFSPTIVAGSFLLGACAGALVTYRRQKTHIGSQSHAIDPSPHALDRPAEEYSRFAMNALIVGRDPEMIQLFSRAFAERHIHTQTCLELIALEQLSSDKFECLVLDCDEFPGCTEILKNIPRPNKNVLVFALASLSETRRQLADLGASCVVTRPLHGSHLRELIRQAYGRMLRDGQSYFRLTIELPVSVRRGTGVVVQCITLNVSQTGMAVTSLSAFNIGEEISLVFAIPNTDIFVSAKGRIIWDDKHGKAGISFECTNPSVQVRFFEWLHDQFFLTRQEIGVANPDAKELLAHVV